MKNVQQSVPFFGVRDIEASLRFYVDGLGFTITTRWTPDSDRIRWCWLQLGGAALMLQEYWRNGTPGGAPDGTLGLGMSVCFICADALALHRELRTRGVVTQRPFVGNAMWVVGLTDPDGYRVFFESATDAPEGTELGDRAEDDVAAPVATVPGDTRFDLHASIEVLQRTPSTLSAMLGGISATWHDATEGGESWSPYVIVGHLIHGERTDWLPRAQIILAQGASRRFEPYDRFAQFTESAGKPLEVLLQEFTSLRDTNLRALQSLGITPAQLHLTGEHPAFGTVTLAQLLACWVAHDLGHIAQVARVMAKQYRDAVGPWREYLPVLDR
ncbi:MAG: DinB family protein [Gemmatimonadota bacterium]